MQSEQINTKPINTVQRVQSNAKYPIQSRSPLKKHSETHHECYKVVDEHIGQNPVVHHHFGQHHPHYYHIEPQLVIKPEQLFHPSEYLMTVHKMKEKVDSYYMKNTQEYVDYWKREYNVSFSIQGYQLIFYDIVVDMEEFLKQDWRNVEYIGFAGAKIDDIKWRLFTDHADLFPNLKWLSLRNLFLLKEEIKHTINVKQGDLERFKSLQRIQFNYEQWTHPLTIPSKNYLKQFAKTHQNIQVVFG